MTDAEALRWLRYALAWMPKDVWEDLKRDAEYPKVQEAIAHVEAAQRDGRIVTQEDLDDADAWADEIGRKLGLDDVGPAQRDGSESAP